MAEQQRPAIFKWRHFAPEVILCAVRWYLRYSLSYREVEELLVERGLEIDHTTVWRWVQRYAPELEERARPHLKATNKSWRVDETYVRIKGLWFYLYRAVDSAGATIDFFLSAFRSAEVAKALFAKAVADPSHPQPRVINTDKAKCYPPAIQLSRPGESHPEPLAEPNVNLSAHSAPIKRTLRSYRWPSGRRDPCSLQQAAAKTDSPGSCAL